MNICFLGSARYANPLDATTDKKFRALSALGELFVIGFSNTLRPQCFTQHAHFYALPSLPLPVLRYLEFFCAGFLVTYWLIFRHDCRVIMAQSPYEGAAAAMAKLLARCAGKRVALIIESHGDFEADLFLQRRIVFAKTVSWIMQRVARFTLNRADALRAISVSTRQQLAAWRPDCPIVQFMAWTDIDAFFQAKVAVPKSTKPLIMYAGVLIPGKGVRHLLNAFATILIEVSEATLLLIGREQDPEYTRQLHDLVQKDGLTARVKFLAEMPQAQLAEYMARAHLFVLPSLSEGLGRVVVEAMAAGTPVIGSRVGGIPDLIQDGVNGFLVPPGDETALAEKIRWMLEHAEQSLKMGQEAYLAAQALFSTEYWLNSYRQIFDAAHALLDGNASQ